MFLAWSLARRQSLALTIHALPNVLALVRFSLDLSFLLQFRFMFKSVSMLWGNNLSKKIVVGYQWSIFSYINQIQNWGEYGS
jgi:hypothetical protein